MTTQTATASFMLSTGEIVDMSSTVTDGQEQELKVSTLYSVSAVSIGQYAEGKSIAQIISPVTASGGFMTYAYVNRRGAILCVLPVAQAGTQWTPQSPLASFALQAGDTIQCFSVPSANANRYCAYSVVTNNGVHAIFAGQAASGSVDLTHILSGAEIGGALTNMRIACHFFVSDEGNLIQSGNGLYVLNDRGLPVGACAAGNPKNLQVLPNKMGLASIGLNFVARIICSA
jgi:hypothetical protein